MLVIWAWLTRNGCLQTECALSHAREGVRGMGRDHCLLTVLSPQSPPYAVTEERRRQAEAVFLELKKSKMPYEMCKYILGILKKLLNRYHIGY